MERDDLFGRSNAGRRPSYPSSRTLTRPIRPALGRSLTNYDQASSNCATLPPQDLFRGFFICNPRIYNRYLIQARSARNTRPLCFARYFSPHRKPGMLLECRLFTLEQIQESVLGEVLEARQSHLD